MPTDQHLLGFLSAQTEPVPWGEELYPQQESDGLAFHLAKTYQDTWDIICEGRGRTPCRRVRYLKTDQPVGQSYCNHPLCMSCWWRAQQTITTHLKYLDAPCWYVRFTDPVDVLRPIDNAVATWFKAKWSEGRRGLDMLAFSDNVALEPDAATPVHGLVGVFVSRELAQLPWQRVMNRTLAVQTRDIGTITTLSCLDREDAIATYLGLVRAPPIIYTVPTIDNIIAAWAPPGWQLLEQRIHARSWFRTCQPQWLQPKEP